VQDAGRATNEPRAWEDAGVASTLTNRALRTLAGVRVGLIGFEAESATRLVEALAHVQAFVRVVAAADVRPGSFLLARFDLLVLTLSPAIAGTGWHGEQLAASNDRPLLLVGSPADILTVRGQVPGQVRDVLTTPLREDEFLLRACLAIEEPTVVIAAPVRGREHDGPEPPVERGLETTPPRVLVADDDATVTVLVSTTLRNYGIECHVAVNGKEALEMARELRFDAIVLDLNMPQLDGFAVLAALRNERATRDVGVVILSSRQQEADILRGFGLGADDYVVKPFNPMELAVRLKRMIRGRRCDAA
jgi:CheY-like chemotaxis protein